LQIQPLSRAPVTAVDRTRRMVAALTDEQGRAVQSEKMVEAIYKGGRLVSAGDQFGVGRKQ
jgi:hypothetical protein